MIKHLKSTLDPFSRARDPIEEQGGLNLYGFVQNDPVNRWDLLGLCSGGASSPWKDEAVTGTLGYSELAPDGLVYDFEYDYEYNFRWRRCNGGIPGFRDDGLSPPTEWGPSGDLLFLVPYVGMPASFKHETRITLSGGDPRYCEGDDNDGLFLQHTVKVTLFRVNEIGLSFGVDGPSVGGPVEKDYDIFTIEINCCCDEGPRLRILQWP